MTNKSNQKKKNLNLLLLYIYNNNHQSQSIIIIKTTLNRITFSVLSHRVLRGVRFLIFIRGIIKQLFLVLIR